MSDLARIVESLRTRATNARHLNLPFEVAPAEVLAVLEALPAELQAKRQRQRRAPAPEIPPATPPAPPPATVTAAANERQAVHDELAAFLTTRPELANADAAEQVRAFVAHKEAAKAEAAPNPPEGTPTADAASSTEKQKPEAEQPPAFGPL